MAKRVFFSFHYQDVIDFRANVVRNHWLTKKGSQDAGFFDASIWETAKKDGTLAIKRLINKEITNTSTTAVLIGSDTATRRWVRYEVFRSIWKANHLIAIHINGIKGKDGKTKPDGINLFSVIGLRYSDDGKTVTPVTKTANGWRASDDFGAYSLEKQAVVARRGKTHSLSQLGYKTYNWVTNNGYDNFASWVS